MEPLPEPTLLECAERVQRGGQVVVGFATLDYRELALNWLVSLDRVGVRQAMLVCLDPEIHAAFEERGLPVVCAQCPRGTGALRLQRLRVVELLVRSGLHVVHSDVDLAWLRHPGPSILDPSRISLVASQGSAFPEVAHRAWGFVLCSGLFGLRSEPGTRSLLRRWLDELSVLGCDQYALNRILLEQGVHWETGEAESYVLTHRGTRVHCFREILLGRVASLDLSVALLPHHGFQRIPTDERERVTIHPLTQAGESRREALERTGGWLLRDDWAEIPFDAHSLSACAR